MHGNRAAQPIAAIAEIFFDHIHGIRRILSGAQSCVPVSHKGAEQCTGNSQEITVCYD
jgi:hypothetical protein